MLTGAMGGRGDSSCVRAGARRRRWESSAAMLKRGRLPLAACAALVATAGAAPARVVVPPAHARFDYQLGGAYPLPEGVTVVSRDRTARPAPGAYSFCYLNGFQTQASELSWWKRRNPDLLLRRNGRVVGDPGWPGEVLLDTSTAEKRARLATIEGRWIDGCASAGFQAVEPDNLDSYSRSHGLLTRAMNVALARLLVLRAHRAGLAVAQKNASELAPIGHTQIGFDFAVAEECAAYRECTAYTRAYGDEVFEIEYPDNGGVANFARACSALGSRISIVYRDRNLVSKGAAGYRYRAC